jgi:serine/threonine protein phosphatase PrpC
LVILASDGLLDNVPSESVAEFITKYFEFHQLEQSSMDHKKLAQVLATQAFKLSSRVYIILS